MLPVEHNDPINAKILAISEDKIEGFVREPFEEIARRSGVDADVVMARIAAMLRAGTIRRVRQTLLATNLADGALVAWKVPEDKIESAFEWMFQRDPFSGKLPPVSDRSFYRHCKITSLPHCSNTARQASLRLARWRRRQAVMARTLGISPAQRR